MIRVLAMMAVMLATAACEPAAYWDGVPAAQKLETVDQVEEVWLTYDVASAQVPANDRALLAEAIARGRTQGGISLEVLTASAVDPRLDLSVARLIGGYGIPVDRVRRRAASSLASTQVVVRVHAVQMRTPVCAGLPSASTMETTALDQRAHVLGCATAANLAAMLVDPRDLGAPPAQAGIASERTVRPISTLLTNSAGASSKTSSTTTSSSSSSPSSSSGNSATSGSK